MPGPAGPPGAKVSVVQRYGGMLLDLFQGFFRHFRLQIFFDLCLRLVEGLGGMRRDLDNVIAEICPHGLADLAHRQRERCLIERRHHLAMLEGSQVTAFCSSARIIRFGLGYGCEIAARQNLLTNLLRLGQGFFRVRSFSFGFNGTEDPLKRIKMWPPWASSNSLLWES